MNRRDLLLRAACVAASGGVANAYAQDVTKLVVPFPAGGPADVFGRMLIDSGLGNAFGRRLIVENRPGAGGTIGCASVARAAPDGSTVLFTSTAFVQSVSLYKNRPYDPIKDFTPIKQVGTTYLVLAVRADSDVRNFQDFLRSARSKPVAYSSAGNGAATHLYGHLLSVEARLPMTHVAYKGEAPALADLLGGQVDCGFFAPVSIRQHVLAGKLRPLAVTGPARSGQMPDVPTLQEIGLRGFGITGWFGMLGPSGFPNTMVNTLDTDLNSALNSASVQRWMLANEIAPTTDGSPQQFSETIAKDAEYWRRLIASANVTLD